MNKEFYSIILNEFEQEYVLYKLLINIKDKIYPVSWKWELFRNKDKSVVKSFREKHLPSLKEYYIKN